MKFYSQNVFECVLENTGTIKFFHIMSSKGDLIGNVKFKRDLDLIFLEKQTSGPGMHNVVSNVSSNLKAFIKRSWWQKRVFFRKIMRFLFQYLFQKIDGKGRIYSISIIKGLQGEAQTIFYHLHKTTEWFYTTRPRF
jgi:hypothetical protein